MAQKNTSTFSHEDILKIIKKESHKANAVRLTEKKKMLKNNIKSMQKDRKKPASVLVESYNIENRDLINGRSSMFNKVKEIAKEVYELGKELATLKSPKEVYIFVSAVWISGFLFGALAL